MSPRRGSDYVVRTIYLTDSSGNTTYDTPLRDDPQDYEDKLRTSMELLQRFTADAMAAAGHGPVTFNLDPVVHTINGPLRADEYYAMNEHAWYDHVGEVVRNALGDDGCTKYCVLAAYTRWDPLHKRPLAHTALGGGNLALFGSAGLFTWPRNPGDVERAFTDETPIDPARTFDDSSGRSTHWGLASTTLGATLHELGHTFGLPHVEDPLCIMSRGFDYLSRAYTELEGDAPPAHFSAESAAALAASRWFAPPDREFADDRPPRVLMRGWRSAEVRAPHGIRFLGFDTEGGAGAYRSFHSEANPPTRLRVSSREIGAQTRVRVVDGQGNIVVAPANRATLLRNVLRKLGYAK